MSVLLPSPVLCYWGPSALWAVLPAVNITDWRVESLLGSALWETPLEEQTSAVPYAQPPLPDGESQVGLSPEPEGAPPSHAGIGAQFAVDTVKIVFAHVMSVMSD